MVRNKKIISIGGGGFTHNTDKSLDQFVLNQVNLKKFKIGFLPTASKDNKEKLKVFIAPGLTNSHYKPDTSLRINALRPRKNEAWLAFGTIPKGFKGIALTLSKKKCLKESAKNLYKMLRYLDKKKCNGIAVQKIPKLGLGIAINDRLKRAAFNDETNVK